VEVERITRIVRRLFRLDVLALFVCFSLIISIIGVVNAIGSTTDIGSQRIWLKPGGSKFGWVDIEIGSGIFDKLPSSSSGGFSLVAETEGKPQFIKHRVDDASASKVSSGLISKCQLYITYVISVDNSTKEGTYTYDVVYNLQNGLLKISCQHTVEVSWEKPAWVVEEDTGKGTLGLMETILVGSLVVSILFVVPLYFLIRKIRRPQYERRKVGWLRAVAGGALLLAAGYVIFDTITVGFLQGAWLFHIIILNLILGVGILLIGIVVLKP